jgi:hypothetical protein
MLFACDKTESLQQYQSLNLYLTILRQLGRFPVEVMNRNEVLTCVYIGPVYYIHFLSFHPSVRFYISEKFNYGTNLSWKQNRKN